MMVAKEEALQLLRSLGVREISESGSFKVAPRKYEMVRYKVLRERRYSIITPAKIFFLLSQRPMFICLFGFEPWCWVRKFKDPVIDFLINAIAVDDVHVYVLRGLITGKNSYKFLQQIEGRRDLGGKCFDRRAEEPNNCGRLRRLIRKVQRNNNNARYQ